MDPRKKASISCNPIIYYSLLAALCGRSIPMSRIEEREGWNLADQLIEAGRQVDPIFGGVERVIENMQRTAALRPEAYRVGIQKRIEVERHGHC